MCMYSKVWNMCTYTSTKTNKLQGEVWMGGSKLENQYLLTTNTSQPISSGFSKPWGTKGRMMWAIYPGAGNKGCSVHKGFKDNTGNGLKRLSALYYLPEPETPNNVCDKIFLPEKNQLLWLLLSCTNINVSSKLALFVTYPLINILFSTRNLTQRAHGYIGSSQMRLFGIILAHAKCSSHPNTYVGI